MTEAWIIDACRTPRGIGKPGRGALTSIHPQRLGSTVLKALAERNNVNTAEVADVIWGCNVQRGQNGNDVGSFLRLRNYHSKHGSVVDYVGHGGSSSRRWLRNDVWLWFAQW